MNVPCHLSCGIRRFRLPSIIADTGHLAARTYDAEVIRAVLFDFGGVILSSPFEEFERYEQASGLPLGTIRKINSTSPDTNAWARLERSEFSIPEFVEAFETEAAALGYPVDGIAVLACLRGSLRPEMVRAIDLCKEHYSVALLTNNIVSEPTTNSELRDVIARFDVVIESSRVGVRKPEARFYEIALEQLGVAADETVFLDDLGINLKPARAMGMATIKVADPLVALSELSELLGRPLR